MVAATNQTALKGIDTLHEQTDRKNYSLPATKHSAKYPDSESEPDKWMHLLKKSLEHKKSA